MSSPTISSPRNPLIQSLRRLQRADERRAQHLFLIEGTHLVQEAMAADWSLAYCLFTDHWREKNRVLHAQVGDCTEVFSVTDEVLAKVATTEKPDGVIAIGKVTSEVFSRAKVRSLGIAVERLQSPDNLGSLLRSVVAAGADGLWVDNQSVDATHPKVLRSSAGQWFRSPPARVSSLPAWIDGCRKQGLQILGAASDGVSVWETDLTKPSVFVLGNEGCGLTDELKSKVDAMVTIPMAAEVESLNVAVAGAVLLFEAQRQRRSR